MDENKSGLCRDYCSRHLSFQRCKSFDEVIQKLQELAEKHSTDDFDEVVVSVSLGRFCTSPTRCQPCIFRKRKSKKTQTPDNSNS